LNFHKITSVHRFQSLHSVESRFWFVSTPHRHIHWCPSSYYNCYNTYYIDRHVPESDPYFLLLYLMDPDSVEAVGSGRVKGAYYSGYSENQSCYCYLNYSVILPKGYR